jgi:hypothetical protein
MSLVRVRVLGASVLLSCFALAGCGKEVGRIPLTGDGSGTTSVAVGSKGLALWTDLDIAYTGNLGATYEVEMLQSGKVVGTASCNPFDVSTKIKSVETSINGKHTMRYGGKMRCSADVPAGATEVKATLTIAPKPAVLTITKMDLVLKE